jgi:hypothetical protein
VADGGGDSPQRPERNDSTGTGRPARSASISSTALSFGALRRIRPPSPESTSNGPSSATSTGHDTTRPGLVLSGCFVPTTGSAGPLPPLYCALTADVHG